MSVLSCKSKNVLNRTELNLVGYINCILIFVVPNYLPLTENTQNCLVSNEIVGILILIMNQGITGLSCYAFLFYENSRNSSTQ